MKIRSMSIRGRLIVAGILELIGVIILTVLALHAMRGQMIDDRVSKVKNLTEMSLGIIRQQYGRFQAGEVTEDEARKTALALLRPLRYDGDGYIFVDDWDCRSILLPIRPEFEGRDFTDVRDANGELFVRHQRDTAIAGGGAVYYTFVKPKSDQSAPKVSYVLPFAPWHWFVATGVYLDDVDAEIGRLVWRFIGMLVPTVLAVSLLFYLVSRSISVPLRQLTAVMVRMARGDYNCDIPDIRRSDEIGHIAQAMHVFRDNGRQTIALQQDLQRSNQELESFAYVASHDLREPLRMINSFSTLLRKSLSGRLSADEEEQFAFVVDGAKRMNQLILDLLEVSRVGRNCEMTPNTSLKVLAEEAVGNLAIAIQESGATVHLPDSMPTVSCNPRELARLFQNLFANAIKYCDADRHPDIVVSSRPLGQESCEIIVADNGIGIPPGQADRVFQIFQRLHGRHDYGGGSGIGLAVCRKIVEHHGGRIRVEPNPDGPGSRFIFTLKLAPTPS